MQKRVAAFFEEAAIVVAIGWAFLTCLLIFAFLLAALGCSVLDRAGGLLNIESTVPVVEPPPEPTPEHTELRSEAADFGARVLARVHTTGADPGAPLVEQAGRAADAVSGDVGKPAKPWSLPPLPEMTAVGAVEAALINYSAAVARDREEQREWRDDVTEQARSPAKRSFRIGSPALGTYLLFGVGGVGAALLAAGRWAWRWRKTALQLVPGIESFLTTTDARGGAGTGRDLKNALSASTDADVKLLIARVKRKMLVS